MPRAHTQLQLQNPRDAVEKGPEGSGHHPGGGRSRAARDKGDTVQMGLTRRLGRTPRARCPVPHEQMSARDVGQRGQPCFSQRPPAEQRPCRRQREGAQGVGRVRDAGASTLPGSAGEGFLSAALGKGPAHTALSRHRSLPRQLLFFPPHCSLTFEHFNLIAFVSVTGF